MKKLTAALMTLMLIFTLASCSSESSDPESTAAQETSAASDSSETGTEAAGQSFDFSEMTVGKITKISNNQVTLELGTINEDSVEKPGMPEGMSIPEDGSTPSMPE